MILNPLEMIVDTTESRIFYEDIRNALIEHGYKMYHGGKLENVMGSSFHYGFRFLPGKKFPECIAACSGRMYDDVKSGHGIHSEGVYKLVSWAEFEHRMDSHRPKITVDDLI